MASARRFQMDKHGYEREWEVPGCPPTAATARALMAVPTGASPMRTHSRSGCIGRCVSGWYNTRYRLPSSLPDRIVAAYSKLCESGLRGTMVSHYRTCNSGCYGTTVPTKPDTRENDRRRGKVHSTAGIPRECRCSTRQIGCRYRMGGQQSNSVDLPPMV